MFQSGNAVERRKGIIRQDEIDSALFQNTKEACLRLYACDFAEYVFALKQPLNQLGIVWVVLERQYA